jgi:hypothetical protein
MALCAFIAYLGTRQAIQTVGKDAVPSIVAAERIRATLADAHANAMNAVVSDEGENGPSLKKFRKDMDLVYVDLIVAAQNITYGDEESKPILMLMTKLGEYERVLGRVWVQSGDSAIATIIASNKLMREEILPAAVALDQVNFEHLTATYDAHRKNALTAALPFLIFVLVALAVLVATQIYLYKKTRRILNPAMAAATMIAFVFAIYGAYSLKSAEAAAMETLRTWNEYRKIDHQITGLLKQGRYQEALKLDLGTGPGQSDWAFGRFDQAIGKTLEINQTAFHDGVDRAFKLLGIFPYVLCIALAAVVVACILGMKPRLDEYRF